MDSSTFSFSYSNQSKEELPQTSKEEDNKAKVDGSKEEKAKQNIDKIVNELLSTENNYYNGLRVLTPFLQNLKRSFPNDHFKQAADVIEKIKTASNQVLNLLKETKGHPIEDQMNLITQALEKIDYNLFDTWSTLYPVLREELLQTKQQLTIKPIISRTTTDKNILLQLNKKGLIDDALISPIQRGPRYGLILNDLKKTSTEAGLTNVTDAATRAQTVVQAKMEEVNHSQRQRALDQLPNGDIRELVNMLQPLYKSNDVNSIIGMATGVVGTLALKIEETTLTGPQLNILTQELNRLQNMLLLLKLPDTIENLPNDLENAFISAKANIQMQKEMLDFIVLNHPSQNSPPK